MRLVIGNLAGSLLVIAAFYYVVHRWVQPRFRRTTWMAFFVLSGFTSIPDLFTTNTAWGLYNLCWVLTGVAFFAEWWDTGHFVSDPDWERPRPDSNRGPSR